MWKPHCQESVIGKKEHGVDTKRIEKVNYGPSEVGLVDCRDEGTYGASIRG